MPAGEGSMIILGLDPGLEHRMGMIRAGETLTHVATGDENRRKEPCPPLSLAPNLKPCCRP